jgi:hypothetical protein
MKYDREKGIQSIIDLQSFVGIDEPREKAEKAWDSFSDAAKESTMAAHEIFCKKKK